MTTNARELAQLGSTSPGRRNLLINGGMQVCQRRRSDSGVFATGLTNTSSNRYQNSPDRWQIGIDNAGTWRVGRGGNGLKFAEHDTCYFTRCDTAVTSLAADAEVWIQQAIEVQNLTGIGRGYGRAKPLALSFWVNTTQAGTYTVNLIEGNDVPSRKFIAATFTVNNPNTWERKEITFPANTLGGSFSGTSFDDNRTGLRLRFWLSGGSNFSSGSLQTGSWGDASVSFSNKLVSNDQVQLCQTANAGFNLTGVQLEVGNVASEFEYIPFSEELLACQRYYIRYQNEISASSHTYFASGLVWDRSTIYFTFHLPVQMRSHPTVQVSDSGQFTYLRRDGTTTTILPLTDVRDDANTTRFLDNKGGLVVGTTAANAIPAAEVGLPAILRGNGTRGNFIAFVAEIE